MTALDFIDLARTWYIATLRPQVQYRRIAIERLTGQGYQTLVPMCRELVVKDGQKQIREAPLFGRYAFVGATGCMDSTSIASTQGVAYLERNRAHEPLIMRPAGIRAIVNRLREGGGVVDLCPVVRTGPLFPPGTPVRITSGPMADYEALFDADYGTRVRVMIEIMGRPTPVHLEPAMLEAVG